MKRNASITLCIYLSILAYGLAITQSECQILTALGNSSDSEAIATGINDSGDITGWFIPSGQDNDFGSTQAFVFADGTVTNLGTLAEGNEANAINNSGQIVGLSINSAGQAEAYLYSGGSLSGLGFLPGDTRSAATSINSSGQIVGQQYDSSNNSTGFLYSHGTLTNLGPNAGLAINDAGTVAGNAINSSGQYAYVSNPSGLADAFHAFLNSSGTITDLGTLSGSQYAEGSYSDPESINNNGVIVGNSSGAAFIYSTASGMQALNELYSSLLVSGTNSQEGFVSLNNATGINLSGEIVGQGAYWNGSQLSEQGFLLNPSETSGSDGPIALLGSPSSVPEPSTWILFLCGLIVLSRLTRRGSRHANGLPKGSR